MGLQVNKSAHAAASELLASGTGGLEELRVHVFADEESTHDDQLTERLYAEFASDFEGAQLELSKIYGEPTFAGSEGYELIPLVGIVQFALWTVGDLQLFLALSHEDRDLPILLTIGTADGSDT